MATLAQQNVQLFQVTLLAADTLLYTCPPLTTAIVTALYKLNGDVAGRTFRLYHVPSGGTIGLATALYYDEPIGTKRVHPRIDTGIVLTPGQTLRAVGSVADVLVFTCFGITLVEEA